MLRAVALTTVLTLGAGLCVGDARADDKNRCIAASEQGQQLRDAGKYKDARDAFTKCARDACPTIVRRDCTRWLVDLTQLWPSVVFGAKDASGNDRTDVTVSADSVPLVSTLDGKPVPIEPGEHVFRFEAAGLPAVERDVLVRAGEKSRLVVAQFAAPPASATPPPATPGATPAPADAPIPTGVWVFGGLALVAFGAEAFFGISGLNDRSSLESSPCAKTATCNPDDVTSIRTKFTVADIALGVGVVSAALSAYLYLSRGWAASKPESTSSHLDLVPTPAGRGAAATWRLEF
jgi:hypothetical protein